MKNYQLSEEMKSKLIAFSTAAVDLQQQWLDEENDGEILTANYPFKSSFSEVAAEIDEWATTAVIYTTLAKAAEEGFPLFVYEGTAIGDPWLDETGRFEVDPMDYYGFSLIAQAVGKYSREVSGR